MYVYVFLVHFLDFPAENIISNFLEYAVILILTDILSLYATLHVELVTDPDVSVIIDRMVLHGLILTLDYSPDHSLLYYNWMLLLSFHM